MGFFIYIYIYIFFFFGGGGGGGLGELGAECDIFSAQGSPGLGCRV